jgi:Protein of unknown function (DUF1116)
VSAEPSPLLERPLAAASLGLELLAGELEAQGTRVERVDWRPPPAEAADALRTLALGAPSIEAANEEAIGRMQAARPVVVDVAEAGDVVPGVGPATILHAGPPIEWPRMAGAMRGAIVGAAIAEGLAPDPQRAARMAESGELELTPNHEHDAVAPMAGAVSASMPVWVVEEVTTGQRAFCPLNEGLGRVLRFGAYGGEVLGRLAWMREVLGPLLSRALARFEDGIDLRSMISKALEMGDECHNRNRAGTSLLLRELLPVLVELEEPSAGIARCARFMAQNDHFFLNLAMPAAKAIGDAAAGVENCLLTTAMTRNGVEFGIRVSGLPGRWFTGPAQPVEGLYFAGYGADDAALDLGDSAITETVGLGGFAIASAPAIIGFVGGTAADAVHMTLEMYEITAAESDHFRLPVLGFRGSPLGIDCRRVAQTMTTPALDTGIAHREAGIGQIGAGLVRAPLDPFVAAVRELAGGAR